jgi:hypothetical protein
MTAGWAGVLVAAVGVILVPAAWCARWAWKLMMRTRDFLDDWAGSPARHGVNARPGMMERLQRVERVTDEIRAETRPNGGNSLRDVVHRTAADVAAIKGDQAAMRARVELFEHQREERDEP